VSSASFGEKSPNMFRPLPTCRVESSKGRPS
jgi:hypothetical protein